MSATAYRTADQFAMSDLAAVWRAAYEGYVVPLPFDAEQLARHILWTGIDLSLSLVGLMDGEPFGLSLAARDGDEAWIGGFGVGVPHRRQGLATQLIAAQAQRQPTWEQEWRELFAAVARRVQLVQGCAEKSRAPSRIQPVRPA